MPLIDAQVYSDNGFASVSLSSMCENELASGTDECDKQLLLYSLIQDQCA